MPGINRVLVGKTSILSTVLSASGILYEGAGVAQEGKRVGSSG